MKINLSTYITYPWGQGSLTERGRLSTVDLRVQTSLDQHIFLKILFIFVTKQANLIRRSFVLSLPLQLVFLVEGIIKTSYAYPGKAYWRGKPSTVDLLELTSLGQLILKLKTLFTFVTKQANLMRRSFVLSFPHQLVFPVEDIIKTSYDYLHLYGCFIQNF